MKEVVKVALDGLSKKAELLPSTVVQSARPASSPLHDQFDWDDGSAAHAFRLEQARRLIREYIITVKVEVQSATKTLSVEMVSVPAYVRNPSKVHSDHEGMVQLTSIRQNSHEASALLQWELDRLERVLSRVEGLVRVLCSKGKLEVIKGRLHKAKVAVAGLRKTVQENMPRPS